MSEWISVKDRLPDEDWVLMLFNLGGIQIGGYVDGEWWTGSGTVAENNARMPKSLRKAEVTHWMPLPERP